MLRWENSKEHNGHIVGYSGQMHAATVYLTGGDDYRWIFHPGLEAGLNEQRGFEASFKAAKSAAEAEFKAWLQSSDLVQREAIKGATVISNIASSRIRELEAQLAAVASNVQKMHIAVPEGFALVPIEPTPEMVEAAMRAGCVSHGERYRAMLSASPATAQDGRGSDG